MAGGDVEPAGHLGDIGAAVRRVEDEVGDGVGGDAAVLRGDAAVPEHAAGPDRPVGGLDRDPRPGRHLTPDIDRVALAEQVEPTRDLDPQHAAVERDRGLAGE